MYEKASSLKPEEAAPYYNKGNMFKALGKNQNALSAYDEALKINDKYLEALNNKGSTL